MLVRFFRPALVVVLLTVAVLGGVAALDSWLQQANVDCAKHDQESAHKKEASEKETPLKRLTPSDYPGGKSAEPKETHYECLIAKYTNELAVFTKVLAIATAVLVLATLGLVVLGLFQFWDTRVLQRAYVAVRP